MGRGRKPRPVAQAVEDGIPEIDCSENKDGNVPQPKTTAEQVSQLLGATPIVSGSKKFEMKHLGGTRRSQRLQSLAAVATPTPGSLDVDQDFTIVQGEEEEGRHDTQPEIPDEQGNQLTGAALTIDGAKKLESKHLQSKRWLQSPAAETTPPPGRLDAERLIQDMTVVGGEEEEGGKELLQQGNAGYEMMLKERCDCMELLGVTPIVSGSKKFERKHLGGTRRSQRLQSPAAVANPTPGSLDVDQGFTIVQGEEEEGRHVTQPEIPDEQGNQLTGAALTIDGAKKLESKHLQSKRWLQSPAAEATPPPGRLDAERLIQDMTVVGGEEEEGGKELHQQGNAGYEMMLKERCDCMELMLQEHKMILEGLTTHKGTKRNFSGETTFDGELSYKNLYFESQKKVAALMEENQQLIRKLEKAHGQIEVYEKLTDAILISKANTKDTDLSVNEATRSPYISQDIGNGKNAKRKKEANDN